VSRETISEVELIQGGFKHASSCIMGSDGKIKFDIPLFDDPGVYAFSVDGEIKYVGVASTGFKNRLNQYTSLGSGSPQNNKMRDKIIGEISSNKNVAVLTISIGKNSHRGLPVDMNTGLEAGIVSSYKIEWNTRGTK
jgi:hypothetical protein